MTEAQDSRAQERNASEHEQALQFLAGLHPGLTIDGPPMAVADCIFEAVLAERRALKDALAQKERALDLLRNELARRVNAHQGGGL